MERYGAAELDAAIREAIERGVPHPNAVRLALDHRRELRERRRPSPSCCPSMSRCAMSTGSRIGSNPMTNSRTQVMSNLEALYVRAKALNLHGLLAHRGEAFAAGWLATLIASER
jgi:hypothetical protein